MDSSINKIGVSPNISSARQIEQVLIIVELTEGLWEEDMKSR